MESVIKATWFILGCLDFSSNISAFVTTKKAGNYPVSFKTPSSFCIYKAAVLRSDLFAWQPSGIKESSYAQNWMWYDKYFGTADIL